MNRGNREELPLVEPVRRGPLRRGGVLLRRAINVGVAGTAAFLLLPILLVVALAVRLSSAGPIFFSQPRVGRDRRATVPTLLGTERRREDLGGRIFRIWKFRTMVPEAYPSERWAAQDDPRVTRIGRFLRQTRLDELPQLFNVLRGDMNVVGPRPEQPGIFSRLRDALPGYSRRQRVLPGITGWAQIRLGYDGDLEDVRKKLDHDLEYIRGCSPSRDLSIMLRTPGVMIGRKGSR